MLKLNLVKERQLKQDETLCNIVEAIKNRFDIAFEYYELMKQQYPELEGLIEV